MSDAGPVLCDVRLWGGTYVQRFSFADELFALMNERKRGAPLPHNYHDYTVADVWNAALSYPAGQLSLYDRMQACGVYIIAIRVWESDYGPQDDPC